nr:BTAD domain-containing putative transcriptional regulator [Lysinibacter cavernae]
MSIAQDELAQSRASAHEGNWDQSVSQAERALSRWYGEPAADLGDGQLAERFRRQAGDLWEALALAKATGCVRLGRFDEAVAVLTELSRRNPLNEQYHIALAAAQAKAGHRTDALLTFAEFRETLAHQLGASPTSEFVQLNAELMRDDAPPTPATAMAVADPIPAQTAARGITRGIRYSAEPLIGRSLDVERVLVSLTEHRLTTILGPGGLGKTSLAHAVAHEAATRVPAIPAVSVAELAGISSPEDVGLMLATALGIHETSTASRRADAIARLDLRSRIVAALSERPTLLVIDNCEHVIDSAAAWANDLLGAVSDLTLLTTSRSPLAIPGEAVYELATLSTVPTGEPGTAVPSTTRLGPAVELFRERARAVRPGAALPIDVVSRLCDRLDGLPLAIELAAARVRSLSVDDIEQRIGDRFALLGAGGNRSAPLRHRTLQAVIEWSWNLLGDNERDLLTRVSLFADGFTLEAAEAVAIATPGGQGDIAAEVDALVQQSLVRVVEEPSTGTVRYRMLETIREFGARALASAGQTGSVQQRMLDWARDYATATAPLTEGAQQLRGFRLVEAEQENLVAALRSSLELGRQDTTLEVFSLLSLFWARRGAYSEMGSFIGEVEAAVRDYNVPPQHANAAGVVLGMAVVASSFTDLRSTVRIRKRLLLLTASGHVTDHRVLAMTRLARAMGSSSRIDATLAELRLAPERSVAGLALMLSGQNAENGGDLTAAIAYTSEAYQLAVAEQDRWSQSSAALALAQFNSQTAHPAEAVRWGEIARAGLIDIGANDDLRQLEWLIAINEAAIGNTDRAATIYAAFVDQDSPQAPNTEFQSIGWTGLAEIALAEGRTDDGLSQYARAVGVFDRPSERASPWSLLATSGCVAAHVYAGKAYEPATSVLVDRLRFRLIASYRRRALYTDKPVAGAVSIGIAAYALTRPDLRMIGLELTALAEAVNSRQDQPTLNRSRLWELAAQHSTLDERESARRLASALPMDDRVTRISDLLIGSAWKNHRTK